MGEPEYAGGVHRVQRIPVTESQGWIDTFAAGVIVFPEADEDDDEIEIDPKDLKIDIFISFGPGRTVREHHVLRRAHDAHPHWHRGEHGREVADPEPRRRVAGPEISRACSP